MFIDTIIRMESKLYYAPTELDWHYLSTWFDNQGYRYYAPTELDSYKLRSSDILVMSVSSASKVATHQATAWRNKSIIYG